ncbi:MAG: diguanylate cyclase, partial [Alphaproteobacteria bacterium]
HPAGDSVIRNLARLLRQRLRRGDTVGRYGGEEFAIILPDTPLDEGRRLLDRLRGDFAASEHSHAGSAFRVSFSGGLAEAVEGISVEDLIVAADTALYEAKRSGRNQIARAKTGPAIRRVVSKRGG